MVFCNYGMPFVRNLLSLVTILILVDGFLQCIKTYNLLDSNDYCHNPYFSRWFSAIKSNDIDKFNGILSQSLF